MHSLDSEQQRESNYAEKESVRTLERRGWAFFFRFKEATAVVSGTTASPNLQPESNTPIHHTRKKTELSQTQSKRGYYIQHHDDDDDDDRGCCHLLPSSRTPKLLHQIRRKYILQKRQKKQNLHEMSRMEKK
jgi:hypothetical protein